MPNFCGRIEFLLAVELTFHAANCSSIAKLFLLQINIIFEVVSENKFAFDFEMTKNNLV